METPRTRTEEDLRAAFALAADDAPSSARVLAKINAAEGAQRVRKSRWRGQWAPLVGVAAVIVAITVPIAVLAERSDSTKSSSTAAKAPADEHVAGGALGSRPGSSSAAAGVAAGSAQSNGSFGGAPGPAVPSAAPATGQLCPPAALTLALTWKPDGGALSGTLTARNHTAVACDLAVEPDVHPLDSGGRRLNVLEAVSAEGYAGPTRLLPGATAASTLTWASWCGAAASDRAEIDWGAGTATVTVSGPTTPSCVSGAATNISASWFSPLS